LNAIRANVYALAGRTEEARALLLENADGATAAPVSGVDQAAARLALGDDPLAYAWLERALANRETDVQYLAVDPRFARVRSQERYRGLLARAGLDK
jgi:hypothetical protein